MRRWDSEDFSVFLTAAKELAQIDGDVEIVVYPQRTGFSLFSTTSRQSSIADLIPDVEIQ